VLEPCGNCQLPKKLSFELNTLSRCVRV